MGPEEGIEGEEWDVGPNVRVDRAAYRARLPEVAITPSGEVIATWIESNPPITQCLLNFAYSTDAGTTWSDPESVDPVDSVCSGYSQIALAPSGVIVVVWESSVDGGGVVLRMRKRSPLGTPAAWSETQTIQVAYSDVGAQMPSFVLLDESRYLVSWADFRDGDQPQVYFKRSDDGGATWTPEVAITDLNLNSQAQYPSMSVSVLDREPGSEHVYVIASEWRGTGNVFPDVFGYLSTDGGQTWAEGVRINDITELFQNSYSHSLAQTNEGTLVAVWDNFSGGYQDVGSSYSTDFGRSWSPSERITPSNGYAGQKTSISCDGQSLAAIMSWDAGAGAQEALFLRLASADAPGVWGPMIPVLDPPGGFYAPRNPMCFVSGSVVQAAWDDIRLADRSHVFTARGERLPSDVAGGDLAVVPPGSTLRIVPNPSAGWGAAAMLGEPLLPIAGAESTSLRVRVRDAGGRLHLDRATSEFELLQGATFWDGAVPPGVYFVSLESNGRVLSRTKWCVVR